MALTYTPKKSIRVSKEQIEQAKFDLLSNYLYEPANKNTLDKIATDVYTWNKDNSLTYPTNQLYINNIEYTTNATAATNYTWDTSITAAATTSNQYIWVADDTSDYITIDYDYSGSLNVKLTSLSPEEIKRQQIKERLRNNLSPQILVKRFGLGTAGKPSEARAREALLELIGDQRFRRYLKHGFISIRGKSGRVYQVFPGHKMTKVWENGKHIEDLCVMLVYSSLPPSDSVIMRMLMILDS